MLFKRNFFVATHITSLLFIIPESFIFYGGLYIEFQVCKRVFITPASTRMSDGGSKTMDRNVPFSSAARPTTVSTCICVFVYA